MKAKINALLVEWQRTQKIVIGMNIRTSMGAEDRRGIKIIHSNFIINPWSQKSHKICLCLQSNNQLLFTECAFGYYAGHFINIIFNPQQEILKKEIL